MRFVTDVPPAVLVDTPELVERAVRHAHGSTMLGVDTETLGKTKNEETGLKHHNMNDQIIVMGLAPDEGSRYVVPRKYLHHFKEVLADEDLPKALHNWKFDQHRFTNAGMACRGKIADGWVLDFLIDEDVRENRHDLKSVGWDYFNIPMQEYKELFGGVDPREIVPGHPLFEKYIDYASLDPWVSRKFALKATDMLQDVKLWEDSDWSLKDHYWDVEEPQLKCLWEMERRGIKIDLVHLDGVSDKLSEEMNEIAFKLNALVGSPINPGSTQQVGNLLIAQMGLPVKKKTKAGAASLDEETLLYYANQLQVPEAQLIVDYRAAQKMRGTYAQGLTKRVWVDGRVHTTYNPVKVTGRLSCVAGSTLLTTSRGTFTFEEYKPEAGDTVVTHTGNWKPVLRKIYKGIDKMFRVCLSNGAVLECTAKHLLLTPEGWRSVGILRQTDKVYSYVDFESLHGRPAEHPPRHGRLLEPREADARSHCRINGYDAAQHHGHCEGAHTPRAQEGGESTAILTLQDGGTEPYVGQEWFPTSQLHRRDIGWGWVPDGEGGGGVCVCSPESDGGPAWHPRSAGLGGGASHRRGQSKQQPGQPRSRDAVWTPPPACEEVEVREITALGPMGVWDIEVAEDHSYAAQGFFSHNSSDPNLQNLPQPSWDTYGIRAAFVPDDDDCVLIAADYSQLEMRVLACASGDPKMIEAIQGGLDMHTFAASQALGINYAEASARKDAKDGDFIAMRTGVKAVGFGIVYGAQAPTIANTLAKELKRAVPKQEAQAFIDQYLSIFPGIRAYMDNYIAMAHRKGFVQTISGRFRHLSKIHSRNFMDRSSAERQAINAPIQGSAADIVKKAMIACELDEYLKSLGCSLRLQVHDELVFNCPRSTAEEAATIIQWFMEHPFIEDLPVPLTVNPLIVQTWRDAK